MHWMGYFEYVRLSDCLSVCLLWCTLWSNGAKYSYDYHYTLIGTHILRAHISFYFWGLKLGFEKTF